MSNLSLLFVMVRGGVRSGRRWGRVLEYGVEGGTRDQDVVSFVVESILVVSTPVKSFNSLGPKYVDPGNNGRSLFLHSGELEILGAGSIEKKLLQQASSKTMNTNNFVKKSHKKHEEVHRIHSLRRTLKFSGRILLTLLKLIHNPSFL